MDTVDQQALKHFKAWSYMILKAVLPVQVEGSVESWISS